MVTMHTALLYFVVISSCLLVHGRILEIPLPQDIRECFEHAHSQRSLSDVVGETIVSRCIHRVLWSKQTLLNVTDLPNETLQWISGLLDKSTYEMTSAKGRRRRQTTSRSPRVRKEYRMLTDRERNLFHRALQMLKADTTVAPNKYDALGRFHYQSIQRAHFGSNFMGWHRLLLVVLENALREKVPSVTVPYWDSTLDSGLLDPRSSVIWTPEFLGTGNGFITSGPFAGWVTPIGRLIRGFGQGGALFNWTSIHSALRKNHLANISTPNAKPEDNIEEHHNQVHIWVGGHMAPPALAAFDPVFYLLHAFVDLLWEIFRGLQKQRGVDPTTDFPMTNFGPPEHAYDARSGIGMLLNKDALSDVYTDRIYKYDRPPSCSRDRPDCGSPYIRCDTSGNHTKCVSASIFDRPPMFTPSGLPMAGGSGIRELRSADRHKHTRHNTIDNFISTIQHGAKLQCASESVNEHYMNTLDLGGVVDPRLWAYIAVGVVYRRGGLNTGPTLATHTHCGASASTAKPIKVFIEAIGINYSGNYKEISHFPNDLATSSAVSYIGVRKPNDGAQSDVMLTAYDSCGRVCRPFCRSESGTGYISCAGAIRVTPEHPFLYGENIKTMSQQIWTDNKNELPRRKDENIFVSFLCDEDNLDWPWL